MVATNGTSDDTPLTRDDERELDVAIEQALKQIERGMDPEAALSNLLAFLPAHLQKQAKKRFSARLENKKKAAAADRKKESSIVAASSFRQIVTLIAQKTLERIGSLLRSQPDIQRRVMDAGRTLLRNGVVVDMVKLSDADLGNLPPSAGVAQTRTQETQR